MVGIYGSQGAIYWPYRLIVFISKHTGNITTQDSHEMHSWPTLLSNLSAPN